MQRVTTESGAVYLIDGRKVMRLGPHSPNIHYTAHPDDEWLEAMEVWSPRVGEPLVILWDENRARFTTPVKSVVS